MSQARKSSLTSRMTRSTFPFVLARYGRQARGRVPSRAAVSSQSGA